jgi:Raf kinase inhibitor-like YbhB/YbcL family protein
MRSLAVIGVVVLCSALCHAAERKGATMTISSGAFEEGKPIPARHTCDGEDASPSLKWSDVPTGTKSFALICDDPDAPGGTWVHWVLYGLPLSVMELAEKVPARETLPNGGKQGVNDFKKVGYGGPCPPSGKPHRYYFKVCIGHGTIAQAKSNEEGVGEGDGGTHSGRGTVDGDVPKEMTNDE